MKTMTFSGRTMREAIALAKARFGGDVDILDSGAVGDEVQVTVVVPMARSARRRRALEQVSASINALAASGRAAAAGGGASVAVAGSGSRVAGVEERPTAAAAASAPAPVVSAPTAATVAAGETAVAAEPSAPRRKGRKRRVAAQEEVVNPDVPVAANADDINPPPLAAGESAVASGDGLHGAAGAVDGTEAATVAQGADAPLPQYLLSAAMADLKLAAANDAVAAEPLPPARAPDVQGPVSTLEFQRLRQQQQAGKAAGVAQGGATAATDATGQTLQTGTAQTVAVEGKADAAGAQPSAAEAATIPGTTGTAEMPLPDFAALLQQQRQGIPIDLSALQMPGAGTAQAASVIPTAWTGAQARAVTENAQAAAAHAQAAAAHVQAQPRSRLWQMVDSARRMLGMGRRRRLWNEMEAAVANAAGQRQAEPPLTGFGAASPLSLSSTLAGTASDWPVLSLPADTAVAGSAEDAREAWANSGMGWFEATRRRPGQMRLLRNLLGCHFSPVLARTLVELLPADYADAQADEWLRQMLMRALAGVNQGAGLALGDEQTLFDAGGVFALIGPTGVGKTTSVAKIAAHHVLRHGPRSLALITADVYRIGAQEQLRAFGRMLGVPVQVAQDREVLQRLLKEHEGCRLVLIDTAGISQRDDRVGQLTSALEVSQVRRVLVMNAAAQPGSLEEVLGAFGARDTAGVLLSKVDEAVGLGACLDALVRHRLPLLGYADGQRVPEDYHAVNFGRLVEMALDRQTVARFPALAMTDNELRNLFEGSHV